MSKEHHYRATIDPVPEGKDRPLWSVMIPTFNCADYLRETLASVLAQDPGPEVMQIEVIDDYSTQDDPEAVVKEVGQGRVNFYRQPENMGYIRNFETCLQRSRGHLIHLLHGDDYVREGFYRTLQRAFQQFSEIGAAYCRHIIVDDEGHWQRISPLEQRESGILKNSLERIVIRNPIQTPSIVVRREVYERLGGFDRRMTCSGEDWEMWVRIAASYPFWYETEPLAVYRTYATSLSGQAVRTGQDMRDLRNAHQIIQPYLPKSMAKQLSKKSGEFWAFCGMYNAAEMLATGDLSGTVAQMWGALKFSLSLKVIIASMFYLAVGAKKYLTGQSPVSEAFLEPDKGRKIASSKKELVKGAAQ